MYGMDFVPLMYIPIMGLIFAITTACHAFYRLCTTPRKTRKERVYDGVFLFSHVGLNWAAYGVWITSAAIMTPLGGGLFVAAALVEVLKELFALARSMLIHRRQGVFHKTSFNAIENKMHLNAALINLAVASLLLGVMTVWCFFSGGLSVVLPCIVTASVLYVAKYFILKKNTFKCEAELKALNHYYFDAGGSAEDATEVIEMTTKLNIPREHFPPPVPLKLMPPRREEENQPSKLVPLSTF